jgi:RNA polymerase sigma-70 factor (ECF subfamily)
MNSSEDSLAPARGGDEDAFRLIFEQNSRFIMRFIYGMVGEREQAAELMQETFLRAYRNINSFQPNTKLSTWLCAIAKNVVRESLCARRREHGNLQLDDDAVAELSDAERLPDELVLDEELRRVIHDALAELSEDKRLVFTLKILQQRSYEEIAEITGFSVAKLKSDVHRAKIEMRERIRPYL